jgi:inner membrane protein
MMGATHGSIGFTLGLAVGLAAHTSLSGAIELAFVGSVAALLPDIDHPSSKMRQRMGRIGHLGLAWLPHRGLTHTLIFTFIIAILSLVLTRSPVMWVIPLAYLSHLIGDSLTRRGIPLFWPFRKATFYFLPRRLRIRSGGRVDGWIAALSTLLMFGLLFFGYYV